MPEPQHDPSVIPAGVLEPRAWPGLAEHLAAWLPSQRWFQGKAREVRALRVADAALLADALVLDLLVDVGYAHGPDERYQVPLARAADPPRAVATVAGVGLRDALEDERACRALAGLTLGGPDAATVRGGVVHPDPLPGAPPLPPGAVRRLGVEQSNSSVVVADAVILKVFRRLEDGLNPDVELTRGLSERGFPHVPAQHGALLLRDRDGQRALAVLAAFAAGAREGWTLACAEARAVAAGGSDGALAADVAELGRVVARTHAALREAFGARPATAATAAAWAEAMRAQTRTVLGTARRRAPEAAAKVLAAEEGLLASFDAVADVGEAGQLIRTHGDLHLGQVLADETAGWLVLDFEGEPARPLAERRHPHSPLRDVAGMLRSFDYAAAQAEAPPGAAVAAWRDRLRAAFLDGYRAAAPDGLLPAPDDAALLLRAFELDKAVYELGYELANRPAWAAIPVAGILRLLEGRN